MALHSKRSEGLAIVSAHKAFLRARLKLTGMYILVLASILLSLSAFIYIDFQRDFIAGQINVPGGHELINGTLAGVFEEIVFVDIVILIIAAGISYTLAGYTLRPIQRSIEVQRSFLANAAHELRTPLAVMKNDVEVLLRNPNPTKDRVHATLLSNIEEIDRMARMASDLLLIAHFDHEIGTTKAVTNISRVVQAMVQKMEALANEKGVRLSVDTQGPLQVSGDQTQLERVLLNLLQNAITHTSRDGSVNVEVVVKDTSALISVADTGSGISARDLPHIFEKFYKGENSLGTGLGLPIVLEIVTQHGGTISIDSTEGKGTNVTVRLPLS